MTYDGGSGRSTRPIRPDLPPERAIPTPTSRSGPQPAPRRVPGRGPQRRRPRRSWGWLVVLILAVVLAGGAYGAYAGSNWWASSRWTAATAGIDGCVGTLEIPRLDGLRVPIFEGTDLAVLRTGVGWYAGTADPGAPGNFAVTGHRLGWGQPFASLDALVVGDTVRVTTRTGTYTYTIVTSPTVVSGADSTVLAAVPGDPGRTPTKALLTLTTAASWLPSPERLVVVGELTG